MPQWPPVPKDGWFRSGTSFKLVCLLCIVDVDKIAEGPWRIEFHGMPWVTLLKTALALMAACRGRVVLSVAVTPKVCQSA